MSNETTNNNDVVTDTFVTGWQAHKIVNAALREAGVVKTIPAQMIYNYTTSRVRANKKPFIACEEVDGQVLVSVLSLTEWIKKYVNKQIIASYV